MNAPLPRSLFPAAARVLLAALPVLAACGDGTGGDAARAVDDLPVPRGTLAVLSCTARVAPGAGGVRGRRAARAAGTAPRADLHLLGGQGTYVRLASSNVAYDGGTQVLSFDVTVQNLATPRLRHRRRRHPPRPGRAGVLRRAALHHGGSGTVTVANATGQATFTAGGQDYFQYGGKLGGADQGELGADGILATGEVSGARGWQLNVPASATTFAFQLYVATETPAGAHRHRGAAGHLHLARHAGAGRPGHSHGRELQRHPGVQHASPSAAWRPRSPAAAPPR